MKDNILNVGYGIYTSSEGGGSYNVLIHGDLNYKNVLVTKKNGIVDDFVLVITQLKLIFGIVFTNSSPLPAGLPDILLGITSFGYLIRSVHDGGILCEIAVSQRIDIQIP